MTYLTRERPITKHTEKQRHIHAVDGIQTHNHSIPAVQDSTQLMPTVAAKWYSTSFRTSTTLGSPTLELWVHIVLEARMFVFPCDGKDLQYLIPKA
jgi:hypothetical protein